MKISDNIFLGNKMVSNLNAKEYIQEMISKNSYIKILDSKFDFLDHLDQSDDLIPILIDIDFEFNDKDINNKQYITSIIINKNGDFIRELVKNPKFKVGNTAINNIKNYSNYDFSQLNNASLSEQAQKNIQVIIDKIFNSINDKDKKGYAIYNCKSISLPTYKYSLISSIIKKTNINDNKIIYSSIFYLADSLKSKIKFPQEYQYLIDELKNCDYLIIDEISFLKTSYWFLNVLLTTILLYRIERNKKTIFISDLLKEDFNLLVNKSINANVDNKDIFLLLSKKINEKKYAEFLELFNNLFDYIELK